MADKVVNVGIMGLGTVGGGVAELLTRHQERLSRRLGAELRLAKAADLDASRAEALGLAPGVYTPDAQALINDPDIDIVVELIGGTKAARELVLAAIAAGKHIATANKALLAHHGAEIFAAAKQAGVGVAFEASVGGGIPLIRSLREGLAANDISKCLGILNGTCNFILSEMTDKHAEYADVLAQAQAAGYAEADPTFDVEGTDTAHKLAIIAALVTGRQPDLGDIPTQGITAITPLDIRFAREFGFKIKLLALLDIQPEVVEARVHPSLVPMGHPMANVNGPFNALFAVGDWVDEVLLYGRGAGRRPTASAVAGDVIDLARDIISGCPGRVPALGSASGDGGKLTLAPLGQAQSRYYFRFAAQDQPGVLAAISRILAEHSISIEAVTQKGRQSGGVVPIVMLTHEASEDSVGLALAAINDLPVIVADTVLIRVVG